MRSNRAFFAVSLLFSVLATGATAQESPPSPPASAPPPHASDQDIIVSGYDSAPSSSALPGQNRAASRGANADSRAFVRCIRRIAPERLRPIVEGHARDPKTHDALDWVIRTHPACYPGYSPAPVSPFYGDCNPMGLVCRAVYDRGAIIEYAFNSYAPKFMLMRGDTLNKTVTERFRHREQVRGKFRSPTDRRFYEIVACMVQLEPQRATRLLRAEPGLEKEARFRQQIIAKTPFCTNNAKRVQVDPYQFRIYVADALYHWTIAAKGIETLVPTTE